MNIKLIVCFIVIYIAFILISFMLGWRKTKKVEQFTSVNNILKGMLKDPKKTSKMFKNILGKKGDLGYFDPRSEGKLKELKKELFDKEVINNIKVPLPKFEETTKEVKAQDKRLNKKKKKENFKTPIKLKQVFLQDVCRFSSTSKTGKCPKAFPVFLGAEFSGKNIQCGHKLNSNKKTQSKIQYCKLCCKNEL
jgi:hypothetical protein